MSDDKKHLAALFGIPSEEADEISQGVRTDREGKDADESRRLGEACLEEGDYEAAVRHFRRALVQGAEGDTDRSLDLAAAYEASDRAFEAMRAYAGLLENRRAEAQAHAGISRVFRRYGKNRRSFEELARAIEADPKNPFLQHKAAEHLRTFGEARAAVPFARRAAEIGDKDSFYHYWLGDLLIDLRNFEEALKAMRVAIELSPGDDYLYLRASVAFWGAGRRKEAVQAVRLAGDLDPENEVYHGVLALYLLPEDQEEAKVEAAKCAETDTYGRDQVRRIAQFLGLSSAI